MPGLSPVTFAKCAPSVGNDIKQCGSVTVCSAKPLTYDEFASVFQKGSDFRVPFGDALFKHDFEIRMCETVQNGMYEFLMSNAVNMQRKIEHERRDGLDRIRPFVMARQYGPINNKGWKVSNGHASGGNWVINVTSAGNVPADANSFPPDMIIWIIGRSSGGSVTHTAWTVVSTVDNGNNTLTLTLSSRNSGSNLPAAKLQSPTVGIAIRGLPNKSDFEKWCVTQPNYLAFKDVPFFFGTYRTTVCRSSQYDQWREMAMTNPYYAEYVDIPDIERNKQEGQDWQNRVAELIFRSKPLPYQNLNQYDQLDDIDAFDPADVGLSGLGADGGTCVGKRADPSGIYEQMVECNRVVDLQGAQLNLISVFKELYNMMRVKESSGSKNSRTFDFFMDNVSAQKWHQAWVNYMNSVTSNAFRITQEFNSSKTANWGFKYRQYELDYPQGVVINVVTHYFFDDLMSMMKAAGGTTYEDAVRVIWILDFAGIYPGVIASNSQEFTTGELAALAKISTDYACVLRTNTRRQKLTSLSLTVVVECPAGNLILENFSSAVPDHEEDDTIVYPPTTTTTTSTTPAPYVG